MTTEAQSPFYVSVRSYRNFRTLVTVLFSAAMGFFPTWAALTGIGKSGNRSGLGYAVVCCFALMFCSLVCIGLHHFVFNFKQHVLIDELGITQQNKLTPWEIVSHICFVRESFSSKGRIAFIICSGDKIARPLLGQTTLTWDEYHAILGKLGPWIATRFPHVQLVAAGVSPRIQESFPIVLKNGSMLP